MELEKERQEHIEQLRKEYVVKPRFKPTISKMSQELEGREILEVNKTWVLEKEKKLNELRDEKQKNEDRGLQKKPSLNARTLKLVSKMKERRSTGVPIEEYLEQLEQKRQEELVKKTEKYISQTNQGTPKISSYAAALVREGPVSTRLFKESLKIREQKTENERRKILEEQHEIALLISPNRRNSAGAPVFEELLKRDEQIRLRNQEKMQQLLEKERELHHPKINPVSRVIASNLPNSSKDRLYNGTKLFTRTPRQTDEEHPFSFKPEICAKSRDLAKEKGILGPNRIVGLMAHEKKKQDNLKSLKLFYNQRELEECTFTPRTRGVAVDLVPEAFNDRIEKWEKKRKEKVAKEKTTVDRKELESCTFKPNTEKGNGENRYRFEPNNEDPLGFDEFVQRQKQAREMKESVFKGVFSTGERWRNQVTVPQEFQLGKNRSIRIRSLQRPLSPPTFKHKSPYGSISPTNVPILKKDELLPDQEEPAQHFFDDYYDEHANLSAKEGREHITANPPAYPMIDADCIPPQGVFSVQSTTSILDGLNFTYYSPDSSENKQQGYFPKNTQNRSPSTEWEKRRKEKEGQHQEPRDRAKFIQSPRKWAISS